MSGLMITIQFYSLTDTDFIFTPSFFVGACDAMQLHFDGLFLF